MHDRILRHYPGQGETWRNLAVLYRHRGRLREAIAAAQAGRLHYPQDADLLLLHAVLLREGGDLVNAETCLLRLLESDDSAGPTRQRRATAAHHFAGIYRYLGRLGEADAHWRALRAESPDFADTRRGLAEGDG